MTLKVVIVDDEPDIRRMCAKYLEALGIEVYVVESPFQVAEVIKRVHPDVLLSDVMMPGFDGGQLVKLIQALNLDPSPKIVFYSAMDESALEALANSYGAGYVSKSAGLKRMHQAILQAVSE